MTNKRWILRSGDIRDICVSWLQAIEINQDGLASNKLEVVVKPYKKNRSLEQNDMFHAWCGTIADKTGHSKQEIKQIMVETTFGSEEFLNLKGLVRTRLKETSGMNVGEMSELLERTIQIGIELGAEVPETRRGRGQDSPPT
jgi:hypothetical protein